MRRREFMTLLGGAAAWPGAAWAQQPAVPVIGFVSTRSPEGSSHLTEAFRRGLNEGGFIDGQNVAIEFRWADGDYGRVSAIAADLVTRKVTVIAAVGGEPAAKAARQATSTIPILFVIGSDPITLGLVASYNRPGGNVTGINILTNTLEPKRLGILHDLVPQASRIATLVNPKFPAAEMQLKDMERAAQAIGMETEVFRASTESEIDAAFQSMARRQVPALIVAADPFFNTHRSNLIALAARYKLPAIYQLREYAVGGGLMSYGVDLPDAYRQAGVYTARVLKGAKPADLPVLQPTKYEFVINLKTAKALGLEIPPTLLARADEVIE
jgi:putative tryptophan/tyrosine transport system substrate-binding protein